jgi:Cd2+/Zn2+-exporting ATPase
VASIWKKAASCWLALDKTGTITHGKPAQTDFVTWGNALASDSRSIAASLAARSDHPVSKAVAQAAQTDGVALLDVAEFNALPGRGVQGQINGATYHLGNHRMLEELGQCTPELEQRIAALETAGKTVVMLVGAKGVHALFAVADTIKDSSRSAIAELHALGINTMMLTGDNPHTAQAIAAQAGIDRAQGNLLPDDKLREVEQLARSGKVGMVGDGINDAPALARADIGFAMGAAGTDTAIETADVALMDDDLRKIPTFVRLSRATAGADAKHCAGPWHQGSISGADLHGSRDHVDGCVRRYGCQLARCRQRLEAVAPMSWKFFLYDWGGLNIALFQAINTARPPRWNRWHGSLASWASTGQRR